MAIKESAFENEAELHNWVAKTVDRLGTLSWTSQRGSYQQVRFPSG